MQLFIATIITSEVNKRSCEYGAEGSYHFTPAGGGYLWLQPEQLLYWDCEGQGAEEVLLVPVKEREETERLHLVLRVRLFASALAVVTAGRLFVCPVLTFHPCRHTVASPVPYFAGAGADFSFLWCQIFITGWFSVSPVPTFHHSQTFYISYTDFCWCWKLTTGKGQNQANEKLANIEKSVVHSYSAKIKKKLHFWRTELGPSEHIEAPRWGNTWPTHQQTHRVCKSQSLKDSQGAALAGANQSSSKLHLHSVASMFVSCSLCFAAASSTRTCCCVSSAAFTFFDPNDPACLEILMDPRTTIPELFAIVRQWVPQVQHKIDVIGNEVRAHSSTHPHLSIIRGDGQVIGLNAIDSPDFSGFSKEGEIIKNQWNVILFVRWKMQRYLQLYKVF